MYSYGGGGGLSPPPAMQSPKKPSLYRVKEASFKVAFTYSINYT